MFLVNIFHNTTEKIVAMLASYRPLPYYICTHNRAETEVS